MYFHFITTLRLSLLTVLLFSACATLEEPAAEATETEGAAESEEADRMPDWYAGGEAAEFSGGSLFGYATASASVKEEAIGLAGLQAEVHLRYWIDEQLELARQAVEAVENAASERDFIMDLRNAVHAIDFADAVRKVDTVSNSSGFHLGIVRVELESDPVLQNFERYLYPYTDLWERMLQEEPIQAWQQ